MKSGALSSPLGPTPAGVSRPAIFLGALLLVIVVLATFTNGLRTPLVLDDYYSITYNSTIRQLWPPGPMLSPPVKSGTGGRPVANASFALSYAFSGEQPVGHHVVSIAVHLLAALALYGVVRRTLGQPALRERFGRDAIPLAALVALLWAVHPLQTQVVTYVSQRTESLMALFYLLTLYCFIRGVEEGRARWPVLAVVACALGMASKEVMVTAPVMVLLYDRVFFASSLAEAWRRRWKLYLGLGATWLLLAALLVGVKERDVGFGLGISAFDYALTECKAVVLYLKLTFWPQPLILDRGPLFVKSLVEALPWVLALGGLLTACVVAWRRRSLAAFAGAWYFIVLAPASSVVPVVQQPIAENRPHLALAGVAVLVALGLYTWLRRGSLVVGGVLVVALALGAAHRNRDFANEVGLWEDTVAKASGNVRAQHNLGAALHKAGRLPEAVATYEALLVMDPGYFMAHASLADTLCVLGRDREAIPHYRQALQAAPRQPKVQVNLGIALHRTGQTAEALQAFQQGVQLDPASADGHYNLGTALLQANRLGEAENEFRAALAIDGLQARSVNGLGLALMQSGRIPAAMEQFKRAIALDPAYVDPHINLGVSLANTGKLADAIAEWEVALRLNPQVPQVRDHIARARQMLQAAPPAR